MASILIGLAELIKFEFVRSAGYPLPFVVVHLPFGRLRVALGLFGAFVLLIAPWQLGDNTIAPTIAIAHTVFNVVNSVIFLPMSGLLAKIALKLADYVVTEAGFGSELGAEKFFNIVCKIGGLKPDAVVLVVSVKALKRNGYGDVKKGLKNLEKHLENLSYYRVPLIVAINHFIDDTDEEIETIESYCNTKQISVAVADIWSQGGGGGIELAGKLVNLIHNNPSRFCFLYDPKKPVKEKIETITKKMYGAGRVIFTVAAEQDITLCEKLGLDKLPICIAKTQFSLSDNPEYLGRADGCKITVREIKFSAGAGFLVPMTGKITTMPGLPAKPTSESFDIDDKGNIFGLY